jgi:hypothetical protein
VAYNTVITWQKITLSGLTVLRECPLCLLAKVSRTENKAMAMMQKGYAAGERSGGQGFMTLSMYK